MLAPQRIASAQMRKGIRKLPVLSMERLCRHRHKQGGRADLRGHGRIYRHLQTLQAIQKAEEGPVRPQSTSARS